MQGQRVTWPRRVAVDLTPMLPVDRGHSRSTSAPRPTRTRSTGASWNTSVMPSSTS